MRKVSVGKLAMDIGTRATIVPWDDLRDWFGGPPSGNGNGLYVKKAVLAEKLVVLLLLCPQGRQCIS